MPARTNMVITPATEVWYQTSTRYFNNMPPQEIDHYISLAPARNPSGLYFLCADAVNHPNFVHQLPVGSAMVHANAGNCVAPSAKAMVEADGAAITIGLALSKPSMQVIMLGGHQGCAFCEGCLDSTYLDAALKNVPGGDDCRQYIKELALPWINKHGDITRSTMRYNYGDPPNPCDVEKRNAYAWLAVKHHTIQQLHNILSYKIVQDAIAARRITVTATILQLTPKPQLLWYDPFTNDFHPPVQQEELSQSAKQPPLSVTPELVAPEYGLAVSEQRLVGFEPTLAAA